MENKQHQQYQKIKIKKQSIQKSFQGFLGFQVNFCRFQGCQGHLNDFRAFQCFQGFQGPLGTLQPNFQKLTRWTFCFFSYSCLGGLILKSLNSPPQEYEKYRHFKHQRKAKSDQSLLHFKQHCHRLRERVSRIKSCIEQNILLLLFISMIRVILYCKVLKVSSFKSFSSFFIL